MTTAETAAARRALIAAVLNCLIPPGEGFPGAGEVATGHIERVLGHAEPSAALLSDALDAIAQAAGEQGVAGFASLAAAERVALLRVVEAARPECFDALLSHTYGGYYSQPAVLRLLGRDAHPPQPQGYRLEPLDLRLIEGVGRRAPFWRQA